MKEAALEVLPIEGTYVADLHGRPDAFIVGNDILNGPDLSRLISADDGWSGQPVILMSCRTGEGDNPVAQAVADELGVVVTAPTELAWNSDEGEIIAASKRWNEDGYWEPTTPHDGEWIDFHPNEKG